MTIPGNPRATHKDALVGPILTKFFVAPAVRASRRLQWMRVRMALAVLAVTGGACLERDSCAGELERHHHAALRPGQLRARAARADTPGHGRSRTTSCPRTGASGMSGSRRGLAAEPRLDADERRGDRRDGGIRLRARPVCDPHLRRRCRRAQLGQPRPDERCPRLHRRSEDDPQPVATESLQRRQSVGGERVQRRCPRARSRSSPSSCPRGWRSAICRRSSPPYESASARSLARRSAPLEQTLTEGEARAVEHWGAIMDTLELWP